MITYEEAVALRALVEKAAGMLDDKDASLGAKLYPRLKGDGSLVATGTRINWKGTLKRASVDLWDREENDPDHNPELWEDIAYREGYRVLTGAITAANPVQVDEICWYGDALYKNTLGTVNTWLPDEYPEGWSKLE